MKKGIFAYSIITRSIYDFLKERWDSIIAPDAVWACKKADALKNLVSTIEDRRRQERKEIIFQHQMCKKLGVPEEQYRARIMALLESRSPNLISKDIALILLKIIEKPDSNNRDIHK